MPDRASPGKPPWPHSAPDGAQSEVVKTVQYILAVPRTFLRSREAAEASNLIA